MEQKLLLMASQDFGDLEQPTERNLEATQFVGGINVKQSHA